MHGHNQDLFFAYQLQRLANLILFIFKAIKRVQKNYLHILNNYDWVCFPFSKNQKNSKNQQTRNMTQKPQTKTTQT